MSLTNALTWGLGLLLVGSATLTAATLSADESGPPALAAGGFDSAAGPIGGGEFAVRTSAGQLAGESLSGGGISLDPGSVATDDACPLVAGFALRQGCDLAVGTSVDLHIVAPTTSVCLSRTGKATSSCRVPVDQARVKAYRRAALEGLVVPGTQPGAADVVLRRTPDRQHLDELFASSTADRVARVTDLGCLTGPTGECLAGVMTADDLFVVVRWEAPDSTVHFTGSVLGNASRDGLVTAAVTFVERHGEDGSVRFSGG